MGFRVFIVGLVGLIGPSLGCAGTGEFTEPVPERSQAASSDRAEPARKPMRDTALELAPTNLVVHNYNLTLVVSDTSKAMKHASTIFERAGAEVQHSDLNPDNATLSATVPRSTAQKVVEAVRALGKVTNENTGRNDMRVAMHELRAKVTRLRLGEMAIAQLIRETTDADVVDALVAQLELSRREHDAARQQIASYEQQGRGDNVYINFTKTIPQPPPPHPIPVPEEG